MKPKPEQITLEKAPDAKIATVDGPMPYEEWCRREGARLLAAGRYSSVSVEPMGFGKIALFGLPREEPVPAGA